MIVTGPVPAHPGVSCTFHLDAGGSTMSLFLPRREFHLLGCPAAEWPPAGNFVAPFGAGTTVARIVDWFLDRVSQMDIPHVDDFSTVTRVEISAETDGRAQG